MSSPGSSSFKQSQIIVAFSLIVFVLTVSCKQNSKPEVAQWRGPDRSGTYNETNLLNEWPENGPELLWMSEGIGKGYAAPAVLNDKIFINGEQDSSSFLFAFDLNGKLLWKSPNGKEFMGEGFSATYPGSRSTPTVVDDLVYTTSGTGRVACFETTTGAEKWAIHNVKDLGGSDNMFGYSESVVVDDNKVYCFTGGAKNNMVALDRYTGDIIWSSAAMKDTFSYCSPVLVELPEHKVLVTHSRHNLYAVDCENGKALGAYKIVGYEYDGEHCNSPLYDNGNIYFIGNEKECGAVRLELSPNGESLKEVWCNPKIKNNFNGYVKVGNHLFTTVKGNWLKALDIENGMVADSVKVATGSIIYADNKFICYGMNGEVNLVTYNENKFNINGTFKVKQGSDHHFSHPVLANGVMYIRHGNALMAYKVI
ncbi:PQQ-like beta-propeller repeat protein [Draconibacterium sp.]|nr:PQQ-like beta-propeller repeat protein [Draconibacterium sp.]